MSKTNLEWLLELPQDKIKEAVEATIENYGENAQTYLFRKSPCLSETLFYAFSWITDTPKTLPEYWLTLHQILLNEGK